VIILNGIKKNSNPVGIGIYVRESRDENEENIETIETQKGLLLNYALENKLGTVYKIYIDDNVSGTTFDRPGIKELEQDILDGQITLLLVKDLSRLGRNNAKTLVFLDFLEEHGVRVISSDGRFDSNVDGDLVGIETWFNERYAKDISRKIRSNLKHKISQGEFLGKPPYGYIKSISPKNTLQINIEQAQIVKQIYKMYLEGFGYSKIANFLNENKIPSPAKAKGIISHTEKWNSVAIQRILSNRVYLGKTIQGVSEKISFKSKKTRRLPTDRWVVTPDTHEKIIEDETFKAVEELRVSKKAMFSCTDKGTINTYRGMIYCGRCGSVMYARKRKGRELGYICQNYAKQGKTSCSSHFIRESTINAILSEELKNSVKNDYILIELNLLLSDKLEFEKTKYRKERIIKNIRSYKSKQEKIYMDMLEELISKDLFIRMNNNIEENIQRLTLEFDAVTAHVNEVLDAKILLEEILSLCEENKLPYQLSKLIVKKITVYETGECLQTNLQGENTQINAIDGIILVELNY